MKKNNFKIEFNSYQVNKKYEGLTLKEWEEIFKITDFPILIEYFNERYNLPVINPIIEGISEH